MSDNTEFDPFNQPEGAADVSDAVSGDDILDGVSVEDDLDDLFAGADMELSEDEGDAAVRVYESGDTYTNPTDVGLKDKMWVPVRIQVAAFKEKHKPRLSSKVCVAVKVDENTGKKRVFVPFDQVEAQVLAGATEVVGEYELPYFICEANHVAPDFGQRRYPYEIEVPALTIKTAFFKEQRTGRKGFKNEDGRSLRVAAEATQPGEPVNLKTMPGIASRMEGMVVMAQITLSTKTKMRPYLDANNKPVSVLLDLVSGAPITVFAMEKQAEADAPPREEGVSDEDYAKLVEQAVRQAPTEKEYMLNDGSGQIWEGNPKLLVPLKSDAGEVFAIADSGENSGPLMEEYVQTTDYLKTKFMPVPERQVEVELHDGTVVKGEITWGTVGAITLNKTPGVPVDIILGGGAGDRVGKTITAVWLGTQWTEIPPAGAEEEGGGLGEFAGAKNL